MEDGRKEHGDRAAAAAEANTEVTAEVEADAEPEPEAEGAADGGLFGPGVIKGYALAAEVAQLESADGNLIVSKQHLLVYSLLHQLALLAIGLAGWAALGCRWWLPLTTYVVIGHGLWVTHWAGHRRWIFQKWFDHHTIGHHVKSYPP